MLFERQSAPAPYTIQKIKYPGNILSTREFDTMADVITHVRRQSKLAAPTRPWLAPESVEECCATCGAPFGQYQSAPAILTLAVTGGRNSVYERGFCCWEHLNDLLTAVAGDRHYLVALFKSKESQLLRTRCTVKPVRGF